MSGVKFGFYVFGVLLVFVTTCGQEHQTQNSQRSSFRFVPKNTSDSSEEGTSINGQCFDEGEGILQQVSSMSEFRRAWESENNDKFVVEELRSQDVGSISVTIIRVAARTNEIFSIFRDDSTLYYDLIDNEPLSQISSYKVKDARRIAHLPFDEDQEGYIWVETTTRFRRSTATDTVSWQWKAYLYRRDRHGQVHGLVEEIPVRKYWGGLERRSEKGIAPAATQIDVAFPRPGIMEVTPRTDSLSEEQRCWLGTHVIDSTAAGLKP